MSNKIRSAFGGKKHFLLLIIFALLILSAGCGAPTTGSKTPAVQVELTPVSSPKTGTVTFLVPTADALTYCDGAKMDSQGFKKTITKEVTENLEVTNLSATELINKTMVLAAQKANLTSVTDLDQDFIRISNGTAYIKPLDGWAGVSIFLCAWKPLVETNLLYLADITKVVWLDDYQQWEELK